LQKIGITPDEIRSLGGGSKSLLWNQIKADITNTRIINLSDPETTNLGAAIIAAAGAGMYPNLYEASKSAAKVLRQFEPDKENREVYNRAFNKYVDVYDSLKGVFGR